MPFLKGGRLAVIRTKKYLNSGRIILNNSVKVLALNHTPGLSISEGCDEFIKWFLPQLQFKNPNVQIVTFKNMCPTPFIKIYLEKNEEILIDCSFRSHTDIHDHLKDLLGETPSGTEQSQSNFANPANFGKEFCRQCMCEVYGQVPCSSHIGRPNPWPGQEPCLPTISESEHPDFVELLRSRRALSAKK